MFDFRERLEKRIVKLRETRAANFIESKNDNIYDTGESRGYLRALNDILEMCTEVEKEIKDDDSPLRAGKIS